jgi:hypothetical protein
MEAEIAPAVAVGAEHGAQLVAEAERPEDVAIPRALLRPAAGRLVQRADTAAIARELAPLVHVVFEKLVRDEVRPGLRRNLVAVGAREEQRRGIDRGRPECIHRHSAPQARQHPPAQLVEVEPRPARLRNGDDQVVARRAADHPPPARSLSMLRS